MQIFVSIDLCGASPQTGNITVLLLF